MPRLPYATLFSVLIVLALSGVSPLGAAQLDAEHGLLVYVDYDSGNRLMIESVIAEGPTSAKLMVRSAPLSVNNVLEPGWEELTATPPLDDSCRLFTGNFLETDGFLTPTWLTTCHTSNMFFLVFSDESESLAIQVTISILQDGAPAIPSSYSQIEMSEEELAELMAEPTAVATGDSSSEERSGQITRTPREPTAVATGDSSSEERSGQITRTPRHPAAPYTEGDWYYENAEGDYLEISITEVESEKEALRILEEYDPEQQAIEIGIPLIGEGKNAPEACRQFTFSAGRDPDYVLLCSYKNFGLFVVGSDYDDVMQVAEAYSNGQEDFVPTGYELVD